MSVRKEIAEKHIKPGSGYLALFLILLFYVAGFVGIVLSAVKLSEGANAFGILLALSILDIIVCPVMLCGLKVVGPNEAIVLLLFGRYVGTVAKDGFYWVNPFCHRASVGFGRPKISLKALTLNNEKQKVNDEDGNPIEIGVVVIWRIVDTAKAVFNVDNYNSYISIQADSAIRQVARLYPYDVSQEGDEKSLRGSAQEVSEMLKKELQERAEVAGIEILDTRISHLAYAPEIAQMMLQRQQASAIIAARQKIVDGAVSMVEMALNKLSENKIVEFNENQRAQMVSNLLVILCGNKEAQPIINSAGV